MDKIVYNQLIFAHFSVSFLPGYGVMSQNDKKLWPFVFILHQKCIIRKGMFCGTKIVEILKEMGILIIFKGKHGTNTNY